MALTKLTEPEYITPAFNPIVFAMESTSYLEENFRYLCYLYDCDSNLLSTVTNPAFPNGLTYFNLQKICSSYINVTAPSKLFTQIAKSEEQQCFTAKFAESYTAFYTCTSVQIAAFPVDGYDLQLYFNDDHGFIVGDIISFSGTGDIGDLYNNTWQVVSTPSITTLIVNGFNQGTASSATTASCVLANRQRTNFPIVTSADTEFWVGNSAIDTCDFLDYKVLDYQIGNQPEYPVSWFNNVPQPYYIRRSNYFDANIYYPQFQYPTDTPNFIRIQVLNNSGVTFTYQSDSIADAAWSGSSIFFVPVGPANLELFNTEATFNPQGAATFPILKDSSISYCVAIFNGFLRVTDDLCFIIDDTCSKYTNFELNFLDRFGNYTPFNFTLIQRKNVSVQRNTFKKGLGEVLPGSGFGYSCNDRGTTTINNIITYTYTLQTDWLSEDMSLYFEQLLTSPNVFWNYDGDGDFRPVTLTTNAVDVIDKKNSRLLQYSVTMTQANNPVVQTGS